jgi:phosphoinositide-3-kinase regulatory subunit 4
MITLDPSARPTFDTLLHTSRGSIFPESFYSFLHNYVSSINDLPTPSPFSPTAPLTSASSTTVTHSVAPSTSSNSTFRPNTTSGLSSVPSAEPSNGALPNDSDHRMERIWADYESVEPYLIPDSKDETIMNIKIDYASSAGSSRPYQVCTLHDSRFCMVHSECIRTYCQLNYISQIGSPNSEGHSTLGFAQQLKVHL